MRRHVLVSVCSRCCFSGVWAISQTVSVSRRLYGIASGGSSRCVFPQSSHSITRSRYSFVPSFPRSLRVQVPRTWRFPPHNGHGILSEPVKMILPFLKYRVPFSAHTIISPYSGEQRPVERREASFSIRPKGYEKRPERIGSSLSVRQHYSTDGLMALIFIGSFSVCPCRNFPIQSLTSAFL